MDSQPLDKLSFVIKTFPTSLTGRLSKQTHPAKVTQGKWHDRGLNPGLATSKSNLALLCASAVGWGWGSSTSYSPLLSMDQGCPSVSSDPVVRQNTMTEARVGGGLLTSPLPGSLERRYGSWVRSLAALVEDPAPTWRLTTPCNSVSQALDTAF